MPIYEYYCPDNNKIYQFFAKTLAQGQTVPKCPDNHAYRMEKIVSAFAVSGTSKKSKEPAEAGAPAGQESFFITTDRINVQGPVARIEGKTPGGQRIEAAFERNSAEGLRRGDKLGLTAQKAYVFSAQ